VLTEGDFSLEQKHDLERNVVMEKERANAFKEQVKRAQLSPTRALHFQNFSLE